MTIAEERLYRPKKKFTQFDNNPVIPGYKCIICESKSGQAPDTIKKNT